MKSFIKKLLVFLLPLFIIPVLLYIITDPFKVLYKYDEQVNTNKDYQIIGNRDFQSTELFLWNYKKYKYDSFIFGNSRSMFFQTSTWEKFIKGNVFHFNASAESIYGINIKLKLIDTLYVDIKNALIILDNSTLAASRNSVGHLFIKHPRASGESAIKFHFEMFKGFLSKALFAYIDLFFTGKKKTYMETFGIKNNVWKHDMNTNQLTYYVYDQQIKNNPDTYYKDKEYLFYKRDTIQLYSKPAIATEQKVILNSIKNILTKHKTKYKIIINPLYDQIKLNKTDLDYLNELFGKENVFDFSGINSFTNDYLNFYEVAHYRPIVADSILRIIYN